MKPHHSNHEPDLLQLLNHQQSQRIRRLQGLPENTSRPSRSSTCITFTRPDTTVRFKPAKMDHAGVAANSRTCSVRRDAILDASWLDRMER